LQKDDEYELTILLNRHFIIANRQARTYLYPIAALNVRVERTAAAKYSNLF